MTMSISQRKLTANSTYYIRGGFDPIWYWLRQSADMGSRLRLGVSANTSVEVVLTEGDFALVRRVISQNKQVEGWLHRQLLSPVPIEEEP